MGLYVDFDTSQVGINLGWAEQKKQGYVNRSMFDWLSLLFSVMKDHSAWDCIHPSHPRPRKNLPNLIELVYNNVIIRLENFMVLLALAVLR